MSLNSNKAPQTNFTKMKGNCSLSITLLNGMSTLAELMMDHVDDTNLLLNYCEYILDSLEVCINLSYKTYNSLEEVEVKFDSINHNY